MTHGLRHLCAAACAAVLAAGTGCAPQAAPEQALAQWLDAAVAAVEAKDRRALAAMISPGYADARGNTRRDLEERLRLVFLRAGSVRVTTAIDELTVIDGTAARIVLKGAMLDTDPRRLRLDADAWNVELELGKSGDEWLLLGARWGALGRELR